MPELIAGGPSIPVHLLNELDSGNVVFFCGAGISAGPGSGLPSFPGLVEHVYRHNRIDPDEVEKQALDLEQENPELRRPNFDKALGLLERPWRLGPEALRRTVVERLSTPPTGPLQIHSALIDLSSNEHGVRLITTNFDRRFIEANLKVQLVDTAPKLPVPKRYDWSTVVHLHGLIRPDETGDNLILTAADFGRAYLTERWAARFITELFREFTVVFVGYSMADPVMSYMVDALAAETDKGAQFVRAYAFAHHDGSDSGKQKTRDGWRAKNVDPILYDKADAHSLLTDTLKEWTRIRKDPFHARARIAINEITKMPAGSSDPVVGRVTWALQHPVAAKTLADESVIHNEDDYSKLESWLEMFKETGLLGCVPADHTEPGQQPQTVHLVANAMQSDNPYNLDRTRDHLACWLARHLHVPQLLAWVLRNGGVLHPRLRQEVQRSLADKELAIPPRLRLLWSVLLAQEPPDRWRHLRTSDNFSMAASDSERERLGEAAVESIAPRLTVRPGPAPVLAFRQYYQSTPEPISIIEACGHLKLQAGDEDTRRQLAEVLKHSGVLSRHAHTFTSYLERALALDAETDEFHQVSYLYRPSISTHKQNLDQDREDWTHLVDLARDSYIELAASNARRAHNLLGRWLLADHPLFKRLALHALTENKKADIRLARQLLLAGRKPGVWETELRREVLRFFRLAGSRIPRNLRAEIVRAIHAGPKAKSRKALRNYPQPIRYEKAIRLHRLTVSGARLNKKSRALAEEVAGDAQGSYDERHEFLFWHGEAARIVDDDFAPKHLVDGSFAEVVAAIEKTEITQDELRGLILHKPAKVARALRKIAKQGQWPSSYWQAYLWYASERRDRTRRETRLKQHLARVLVAAPAQLVEDINSAFVAFVKRLAEEFSTTLEPVLSVLWDNAWTTKASPLARESDISDSLTVALNHPAGKLAEAALHRLRKYEPQARAGLPSAVRPYFDSVATDPDGHMGRVILATRLQYLFSIDPNWTAEHLISRLSPAQSDETTDLWSAYGWSPRIGPDLLDAFKEPFLNFLREPGERSQWLKNLRGLFMTISLEMPNGLTAEEVRRVVETMLEEDLTVVLRSLKRRLNGTAEERASAWREKVSPWLHDYWPRQANRNTPATTEGILDMVVESGLAFPNATQWSLEFLRPFRGRALYRLGEHGHVQQNSEYVLRILDRIVDAEVLSIYERATLKDILDAMSGANPHFAGDTRFQGLYHTATQ